MTIIAYLKGSEPPLPAPATGQMRLGTRDRTIHPSGDTFQLVWEEGPIVYLLWLTPQEGGRLTEAQFRAVVSGFTWP
ncbi:MAG TPA: hypothetical protein VF062_27585 [Candidatus Limnocylindrales bacterium]